MRIKQNVMYPVLLAVALGVCSGVRAEVLPTAGMWRAWLETPGGELPFGLEFVEAGPFGFQTFFHNGSERIKTGGTVVHFGKAIIMMDYYGASITATVSDDGSALDGFWAKLGARGKYTRMPFRAVLGKMPRFAPPEEQHAHAKSVTGRWAVKFKTDINEAVGVFKQADDGTVTGTFLTTTGDYRYLAGDFDGDELRLSTFDGAHAFLFRATLGDDGVLKGDFWSRNTWHDTWTAKRDSTASLSDSFALNKASGHVDLSSLTFRDAKGNRRTLSEPEFAGDVMILELFGSWCPNCHDAADYLVDLHKQYGDRGLSIVGLAFELRGDWNADGEQLRLFKKRHHVTYPMLLAGLSDKKQAATALPFLDGVIAYPTMIVLDSKRNIKAIHTGFSGPATGEAYATFRKKMADIIEPLLKK